MAERMDKVAKGVGYTVMVLFVCWALFQGWVGFLALTKGHPVKWVHSGLLPSLAVDYPPCSPEVESLIDQGADYDFDCEVE